VETQIPQLMEISLIPHVGIIVIGTVEIHDPPIEGIICGQR